jgi:hypothetical protein
MNEELGLPKACLLDPKTFDSGAKADRATLNLALYHQFEDDTENFVDRFATGDEW